MEYIYASLLLHKAGKKIDEKSIESVMKAAGITPDIGRIKAVTAALEGVDIETALSTAAAIPVATAPAEAKAPKAKKKKKEKKEEKEEESTGLGALFG